MRRNGFTIVEMLMVIAVLAVLTGIITTAATSSIRKARARRTEAMKQVIQSGLATYQARKGEWPGQLKSWSQNGLDGGKKVDYLDDSQYDSLMQELARESVGAAVRTPMMDVSGLTVSKPSGVATGNSKGSGMDFKLAVKKNKRHGHSISLSEMVFTYQDDKGYFRRYVIQYNTDTDFALVMTQSEYRSATGKTWPNKP